MNMVEQILKGGINMADQKIHEELKVFGMQPRSNIMSIDKLLDEIQKLISENRELRVRNKRLIQIISEEEIKKE